MTAELTALVDILAEQAEARLKELVKQAKVEFYEAWPSPEQWSDSFAPFRPRTVSPITPASLTTTATATAEQEAVLTAWEGS